MWIRQNPLWLWNPAEIQNSGTSDTKIGNANVSAKTLSILLILLMNISQNYGNEVTSPPPLWNNGLEPQQIYMIADSQS